MREMTSWFVGRLPDEWFEGEPEVTVDREEITVVGTLPAVETQEGAADAAAEAGRIARWREDTRAQRMRIADEAEARYGRKVAWGAVCGETRELFTHLAVPVMTRLRQPERRVLDTLVESGVARSRADALAWCVRLVGQHEDAWLASLRDALTAVREAREAGPASGRAS
jgi:Arc/MetJ-type ribon-helix-helix transcriptional regulator